MTLEGYTEYPAQHPPELAENHINEATNRLKMREREWA